MDEQGLKEWRPPGARNFIRVGDLVRVAKGGVDKSGFDAWVVGIPEVDGVVSYLDLNVATGPQTGKHRSIRVERITRKAQAKPKVVDLKGQRAQRRAEAKITRRTAR